MRKVLRSQIAWYWCVMQSYNTWRPGKTALLIAVSRSMPSTFSFLKKIMPPRGPLKDCHKTTIRDKSSVWPTFSKPMMAFTCQGLSEYQLLMHGTRKLEPDEFSATRQHTLCVVVVTTSQYSKGLLSTPAATSPLMCAISIIRNAPTLSAICNLRACQSKITIPEKSTRNSDVVLWLDLEQPTLRKKIEAGLEARYIYLAHARVVKVPRICTCSSDEQFWPEQQCSLF